ncbi:MAG: hypothetical protein QXW10_03115 [Candidatus Micrarchaeaceae archaeon]
MQTDNNNNKFSNIRVIDIYSICLLYEYANKEYNAAKNIAEMADDNMADGNGIGRDSEEARREGVMAGIRAMSNAYMGIRERITSNYPNIASNMEKELRDKYSKQDADKGLSATLKVAPMIGISRATYSVNIDTLFKHYGRLNTAISEIVSLLKEQKESLNNL